MVTFTTTRWQTACADVDRPGVGQSSAPCASDMSDCTLQGRQRPSSHAGDTAGGWPTGDLGGGTHHAAPPSSRPRVVVDEDGWQVPPPELLRQAPGAAARERDELGAGGRWPQRRSASTGRHPRLGRNRGGGISGGEDDWPFSAGGVGGMGMGGLFHMPLMPLGALRDMLGGLGGLEMGLLGLEPVLLPHGLSAADGASGGMGLRPHNASGRYPSGTAGNGGDGYEALVALDEGRVKRVVRPEVVRALPTVSWTLGRPVAACRVAA